MSGIAVVFEHSNAPVDPGVLERVMRRLEHRGPDGHDVCLTEHAALGHWHLWTTPEDVGEIQPLECSDLPFKIVMDGRLDNRPELIDALHLDCTEASHLSDAALVLYAYDRWAEHSFEHFIGVFALAILDQQRGCLVLARDPLGDRSLFYSIKGTCCIAASEPWAVAGANGKSAQLNEKGIAQFFALQAIDPEQTLFKNIYELPPAHGMVIDSSGIRKWRYWKPDLSIELRGKSDQEYAEGFLDLLKQSVRSRLRSALPLGVMMSGGLDSASVASLAARMLAPKSLTTISYVFDELPDADERGYMETVENRWKTHPIQVPCDDLWPYKNLSAWPRNPNRPNGDLYRMVIERTYRRAAQEGLRVLLTGMFGDELYDGEEYWLADLAADGRLREAVSNLMLHLKYAGAWKTLTSDYMRGMLKSRLQGISIGKQLLSLRSKRSKRNFPAWLTPFSVSKLEAEEDQLDPAIRSKLGLLGSETAEDCITQSYYASRYGLELRHPYRDLRLVEYILTLPAYQLYYEGHYKHVLRTAMQGILPEAIRGRMVPTTLLTLLAYGLEQERDSLQSYVQDPHAAWRKYVRADWLMDRWYEPVTRENDGPDKLVPWLCISFSSWYSYFLGGT